jgi:Calcineurin-like phosphoesterase
VQRQLAAGEMSTRSEQSVVPRCAGDLFDDPVPRREWWEQLAQRWGRLNWKNRRVFLLPGNHDSCVADSVWDNRAFRELLPDWVHIYAVAYQGSK